MLYYSASVSWRVWLGVSLTVHESGRSGLNGKLGMIEFVYGVLPLGVATARRIRLTWKQASGVCTFRFGRIWQ